MMVRKCCSLGCLISEVCIVLSLPVPFRDHRAPSYCTQHNPLETILPCTCHWHRIWSSLRLRARTKRYFKQQNTCTCGHSLRAITRETAVLPDSSRHTSSRLAIWEFFSILADLQIFIWTSSHTNKNGTGEQGPGIKAEVPGPLTPKKQEERLPIVVSQVYQGSFRVAGATGLQLSLRCWASDGLDGGLMASWFQEIFGVFCFPSFGNRRAESKEGQTPL